MFGRRVQENRLSVVFLPPNHWEVPADSDEVDCPVTSNTVLHHLRRIGVDYVVENPTAWPWNPLYKLDAFMRGLDPVRAIRVLLRYRRARVVVSTFESSGFFLLLLRRLFLFRAKVVLWDASIANPWKRLRALQRFVFPRYDGFMMLTSSQVDHLKKHYTLQGDIAKINYNVNEAFYTPAEEPWDGYVLAVGDDVSRDYETLLAAARGSTTKFILKTKWRPKGGERAAPPNVQFLSERLDAARFRELYARASVVVLPLHRVEHAGGITSACEAMSMGKALVITDGPLACDFVEDGWHGLVVPPGDPRALREAIDSLLDDRAWRRALGSYARDRVEGSYTSLGVAKRMRDFLHKVVHGPNDHPITHGPDTSDKHLVHSA